MRHIKFSGGPKTGDLGWEPKVYVEKKHYVRFLSLISCGHTKPVYTPVGNYYEIDSANILVCN